MKWQLSLRQTLGLAVLAAPIWAVLVFAVQGVPWALGASYVLAQFGLISLLSLVFVAVLDLMARLLYGRRKVEIATEASWPHLPTNTPAMVPPADYPNLQPKPAPECVATPDNLIQSHARAPGKLTTDDMQDQSEVNLELDSKVNQPQRGENE